MSSFDRRQERLIREERTTRYENQRHAQAIHVKKQIRRIDMAECRIATVKALRELTLELEPARSNVLIEALYPVLSSSRAPYGMIVAFEYVLAANSVDTESNPWKDKITALKNKVSEQTDPNKYYLE